MAAPFRGLSYPHEQQAFLPEPPLLALPAASFQRVPTFPTIHPAALTGMSPSALEQRTPAQIEPPPRPVQQHQTQPAPTDAGGRSARSCAPCRAVHVGCSGGQPCKRCVDRHIECTYSQLKRRGPCARYQQLEDQIHMLQEICGLQQSRLATIEQAPSGSTPSSSVVSDSDSPGDYSSLDLSDASTHKRGRYIAQPRMTLSLDLKFVLSHYRATFDRAQAITGFLGKVLLSQGYHRLSLLVGRTSPRSRRLRRAVRGAPGHSRCKPHLLFFATDSTHSYSVDGEGKELASHVCILRERGSNMRRRAVSHARACSPCGCGRNSGSGARPRGCLTLWRSSMKSRMRKPAPAYRVCRSSITRAAILRGRGRTTAWRWSTPRRRTCRLPRR